MKRKKYLWLIWGVVIILGGLSMGLYNNILQTPINLLMAQQRIKKERALSPKNYEETERKRKERIQKIKKILPELQNLPVEQREEIESLLSEEKCERSYDEEEREERESLRKDLPRMIKRLKEQPSSFIIVKIGLAKDPSTIPLLANILKNNPDYEIRRSAAGALGTIGHKSAIPYLKEALKDRNRKVRSTALNMLIKFGEENLPLHLIKERDAFRYKIEKMHDIPYLKKLLNDENFRERLQAAYLLSYHILTCSTFSHYEEMVSVYPKCVEIEKMEDEILQILIQGTKNKNYIYRELALTGIERFIRVYHDEKALEVVKKALNDPNKYVRWQAEEIIKNKNKDMLDGVMIHRKRRSKN